MKKLFKHKKILFVAIAITISIGVLAGSGNLRSLKSQFLFYTPVAYVPSCVYPLIAAGGTCLPPQTEQGSHSLDCPSGFGPEMQWGTPTCVPEKPFVEKDCSESEKYKNAVLSIEKLQKDVTDKNISLSQLDFEITSLEIEERFLRQSVNYGRPTPAPYYSKDANDTMIKEYDEKKSKLDSIRTKLTPLTNKRAVLVAERDTANAEWLEVVTNSESPKNPTKVLQDCVEGD